MAGILGLGEGGASALNQEIIDKLKDADTKATVDPIAKKIDNIISFEDGEEGEQFKLLEIKLKVAELVSAMSVLDLNATTGTVFDAKSSNLTGTSVTFASNDMSQLSAGITTVNITQVAQKDIYQTGVFSDKTAQVIDGNDTDPITGIEDFITIQVASAPIYQSSKTSSDTATELVGEGIFTITPAGGSAVTITTNATTTWSSLKELIDADNNLTASFINNRLSITSSDEKTQLAIVDTLGTVSADLDISSGNKFTTVDKTYEQLTASINANSKIVSSVEQVGDSSYRLVIKSNEGGRENALTITQAGVDLDLGDSHTSKEVIGAIGGTDGTLTIDGTGVAYLSTDTLADIKTKIDAQGIANVVVDVDSTTNKLTITKSDGLAPTISSDAFDFGFTNDSQVVAAQNMKATIDGVQYDLSSNEIVTVGGLKITATSVGESSLSIANNTDLVMPSVEEFATKYNELVDMIDSELYDPDSPIEDTSSLKLMMTEIKEKIFSSYGENSDKNIFSYGMALDKEGHLSVDTTEFAKALSDDTSGLKELFIGDLTNKGLGTQLKSTLDSFTAYQGLLTKYDENITSRLEKLNDEKEKAITLLNDKYAMMATTFAAYGAMITQMEAAFGGLQMMIQQSIATK